MKALGVDIGGSSVKPAVVDDGAVIATGVTLAYSDPTPDQLEALLGAALAELALEGVGRIGVCAPGLVDPATGVLDASVNLVSLVGASITDLVRRAAMLPSVEVAYFTDAHAAAHHVWHERRPPGRLLAISIGTGVGACVLDDGVPLRVTGQSSGHFGQIDVSLDDNAPVGPDGGRGGLEAYVSAPSLRRAGVDVSGDSILLGVDSNALRALARAIRIAHAIYRPHHVVLLGGVGIRLGASLESLRARVDDHLTSMARDAWTLEVGSTPHHAAIGAALLASAHG
jgi:predicted NBD/HSP70 family sugar kinase